MLQVQNILQSSQYSTTILSIELSFSQEIPDGPYLGQIPPGLEPEIFAPGIISFADHNESHPTFLPDGKEFYFAIPLDD